MDRPPPVAGTSAKEGLAPARTTTSKSRSSPSGELHGSSVAAGRGRSLGGHCESAVTAAAPRPFEARCATVIPVLPRIVVSACLSEDARAALAQEGFDIVDCETADLAVIALDELPHVRGMRVIVVAAERDAVEALTAGADDVVPRSVAPVELAARMRAILRRTHTQETVLRYADVVLDVTRREARRGGPRARAHGAGAAPAPLPARASGPRPLEGADPRQRVADRAARVEHRRDVRQVPATEARRARAAVDPHRTERRLHPRRFHSMSAAGSQPRTTSWERTDGPSPPLRWRDGTAAAVPSRL